MTIRLDAQRLGVKVVDLRAGRGPRRASAGSMLDNLVAHGVRAQLRSGNLLTGALFVAFDFFPDAPPATVDWSQTPVAAADDARASSRRSRPASPASSRSSTRCRSRRSATISDKAIVELDQTLVSARGALDSGRGTLDNANKLVEPNSVLGAELGNTLQEVSRAARSVRVLADYLERHPEALIRGKTGEAK